MKKRIGILTAGGDCPGLNATIRAVAKSCYKTFGKDNVEIVGIQNGFSGLIKCQYKEMVPQDFRGILTLGGTILGSKRTPFKLMRVIEEDNVDKVKCMKDNYKKLRLDCLLTLGGNGTHKTANLLSEEGLNVIGLPKTIDNDIWGTDVTFGFHSAVDIATEAIDRLHTTAKSHSRAFVVEIMGNKSGWLTLSSGVAGGADVIIVPEIAYCEEKIVNAVMKRKSSGNNFSIIAVAEGAMDKEEASLEKDELKRKQKSKNYKSATQRIAKAISNNAGIDTRIVVPGHILRGGTPSAYDRLLSTQFGAHAVRLIAQEKFGVTVAMKNGVVTENSLHHIAGKKKVITKDNQVLQSAKEIGICFGD